MSTEKAWLFYIETYLMRKCLSGCVIGLDNTNLVSRLFELFLGLATNLET